MNLAEQARDVAVEHTLSDFDDPPISCDTQRPTRFQTLASVAAERFWFSRASEENKKKTAYEWPRL